MKKFFGILFLWGAVGSQSFGMMGEDDGSGAGPSRPRASAPQTTEDGSLAEETPTPDAAAAASTEQTPKENLHRLVEKLKTNIPNLDRRKYVLKDICSTLEEITSRERAKFVDLLIKVGRENPVNPDYIAYALKKIDEAEREAFVELLVNVKKLRPNIEGHDWSYVVGNLREIFASTELIERQYFVDLLHSLQKKIPNAYVNYLIMTIFYSFNQLPEIRIGYEGVMPFVIDAMVGKFCVLHQNNPQSAPSSLAEETVNWVRPLLKLSQEHHLLQTLDQWLIEDREANQEPAATALPAAASASYDSLLLLMLRGVLSEHTDLLRRIFMAQP